MSFNRTGLMCALAFAGIFMALLSCGCLTYSFGDVWYDDGSLNAMIKNDGDRKEVVIQATVFDLSGFRQVQEGVYANAYVLDAGENLYQVPLKLDKGSYKIYPYVLEDGKRSSAVIRNIEVV